MIYEHRTYSILPGKMNEFVDAFGEIIVPLFKKHGAKLVGSWRTSIGQSNEFVYILAFKNMAEQEKFWNVFHADPAFGKYLVGGLRVGYATSKILSPTAYSPMQ